MGGTPIRINEEALFQLGQALQEPPELLSILFLDVETGKVVSFAEKEPEKIRGEMSARYLEIPSTSHAMVHQLLDEFINQLGDEGAQHAASEKQGVGETLDALDEYGIDSRWEFPKFIARRWLASIGIEITENKEGQP